MKHNTENDFYDPKRVNAHEAQPHHADHSHQHDGFHHELHQHHHHAGSKHHHKSWHKNGHVTAHTTPGADTQPLAAHADLPPVTIDHATTPPKAPEVVKDHPAAPVAAAVVEGSGTLKSAIDRAKAGGKPLVIAQIGDSHIAAGIETPALANEIARDAGLRPDQVSSSSYGHPWKTAEYADQHKQEFLSRIRPDSDLVVVSFGSNDSAGNMINNYQNKYKDLLQSIHERAPHAQIVAAGPFDGNVWNTDKHLPQIDNVIQAQRNAAAEVPNTTYVNLKDQFGSVSSLRNRGYMVSDRLHLTSDGYKAVGALLGDDIIKQQR